MSADPAALVALSEAVAARGGRIWAVGGAVRDGLLGRPSKDTDLEVFGLSPAQVAEVLGRFGRVDQVGRSFSVFKLRLQGEELDVACPEDDPPGPVRDQADAVARWARSARRRDLTINALAQDLVSGEILDVVGGLDDLRARRLAAVDEAGFATDPLRVARVARFAAQLGFAPSAALLALGRRLPVEAMATERLVGEVDRLLLAAQPAWGYAVGGALDLWSRAFPELVEGPRVGGALGRLAAVTPLDRPLLGWAALLVDTPPVQAAALLERNRIQRRGGLPFGRTLGRLLETIAGFTHPPTDADLRGAADGVELRLVVAALGLSEPELAAALEPRVRALGLWSAALPNLLSGGDLLAMGIPAGPELGRVLLALREAQREGRVTTMAAAKAWVAALYSDGATLRAPATRP